VGRIGSGLRSIRVGSSLIKISRQVLSYGSKNRGVGLRRGGLCGREGFDDLVVVVIVNLYSAFM